MKFSPRVEIVTDEFERVLPLGYKSVIVKLLHYIKLETEFPS